MALFWSFWGETKAGKERYEARGTGCSTERGKREQNQYQDVQAASKQRGVSAAAAAAQVDRLLPMSCQLHYIALHYITTERANENNLLLKNF